MKNEIVETPRIYPVNEEIITPPNNHVITGGKQRRKTLVKKTRTRRVKRSVKKHKRKYK